jgi:hypothetical protein
LLKVEAEPLPLAIGEKHAAALFCIISVIVGAAALASLTSVL